MKRKKLAQRATSAALAACMMFTLSAPALAESTDALMQLSINSRSSISVLGATNSIPVNAVTLDIANGDIEVSVSNGKLYAKQGGGSLTECPALVVTGTGANKLTIKGESGMAAKVYLNDLHIIASSSAAVSVSGEVDLFIEGSNTLQSGTNYAGVQKEDAGLLTIDGSGSLEARGGTWGAGIGGANGRPGSNIVIEGGTITAIGGGEAAGIGGGLKGNGTDIIINDGNVTAVSGGGQNVAAIGGGRVDGVGSNIQITGGTVTLKKGSRDGCWIGGRGGEITIDPDTTNAYIKYLDENGTLVSETNVKYGIMVNGTELTKANIGSILGGVLSYDPNTKTLTSNDAITGDLTIEAPNDTAIELYSTNKPAVKGKLTVTSAKSVKVTSESHIAVSGDVEIDCDGKVEITSGRNTAVYGSVTVHRASEVAISGQKDANKVVVGDLTVDCNIPVTVQNNGSNGVFGSITYGGEYVYRVIADGTPIDPRVTPISTGEGYVSITPAAAVAIDSTNTTLSVLDSKAYPGTVVTATVNAPADTRFDGWEVSENVSLDDAEKKNTSITFIMPDTAVTLDAVCKTVSKVTVKNGEGKLNGVTVTEAAKDDILTITGNNTNPGKVWGYWNIEKGNVEIADPNSESTTLKVLEDGKIVVKAKYMTPRDLIVTNGTVTDLVRENGVVADPSSTVFWNDRVTIAPKDRSSEMLKFDHWKVKSGNVTLNPVNGSTKTVSFTMPNGTVELEAVYNNVYTATVNDGTDTITKSGIAGTEVTVTANVPAGEKFTGWELECDDPTFKPDLSGETVTFNMPNANVKLTAKHKTIRSFTVVGGTIDGTTETTITAIEGDKITVHPDLPENQEFLHWVGKGFGLDETHLTDNPLTITMPDNDVTITAVPKQLYTVTVVNGTVHDKSSDTANPGDRVTIIAADRTNQGQVFVGWTVKSVDEYGNPNVKLDSNEATTTFTMISANVKVEANYEQLFNIDVTDGTATDENGDKLEKAIKDTKVTVTATDKTSLNLAFDYWEVKVDDYSVSGLLDNIYSQTAHFDMVRGNVELIAHYKTLNTINVRNGKAEVDGREVDKAKEGDTVTITADPKTGKRFKGWIVNSGTMTDLDLTANPATFTMKEEYVDVEAAYVDLYDLSVIDGDAYDEGDNVVTSAAEGDKITAKADPARPNDHFTGWTVENGVVLTKDGIPVDLTDPEITFDMPDGPVKLRANYSYVYDQTVKVIYGTAYTDTIPAADEITVTPGKTVHIEPADRMDENLVFTGWEVTSGKGVTLKYTDDGVNFTMPQSDEIVELTAQYEELHAVTINEGTAVDEYGDELLRMNDDRPGAIAGTKITITAKDKPAENKVFDHWDVKGDKVTVTPINDDGSEATFTMIDEDVEITAVYKNVHTVTVHTDDSSYSENFDNIKEGTEYEVTAPEIAGKRFDHWIDNNVNLTDLTEKTNPGTFTMPDENVDLTAVYVKLYDVTVKYGEPVNETVETETTTDAEGRVVLPAADGDKVTVTADDPYPTETFDGWTLTTDETIYDEDGNELLTDDEGYILKDGERLTDRSFTFVMPAGAVSLKANYSMPAYVMSFSVEVEGGKAFVDGEEVTDIQTVEPGTRVDIEATPLGEDYPGMVFDYWEIVTTDDYEDVSLKNEHSASTYFSMPVGPVKLVAHWAAGPIDGVEEPLDPDFGVDYDAPGGDGGAGAAIAGVAIGGAAIWGGYEITTRIILNDLLPEGAAIPANRGQLAMLIWTEKGKPEPAAQPAFADVTDAELAKAAQWCVEQGLLDAQDNKFDPDGWMPKFKTIEIWKKAFPQK